MEREIKIKIAGEKKVQPDKVILSFRLENLEKNYKAAIKTTAENLNVLFNCLSEFGFKQEDLKTTDLDVTEKVEDDYDFRKRRAENKGKKEKEFYGYECVHRLELITDLDCKLVGKVLDSVKKSGISPKISIGYMKENTREESRVLLRKMAEEARKQAEEIVGGAGGKVGSVNNIFYGVEDDRIERRHTYNRACKLVDSDLYPGNYSNIDLYPEDIIIHEVAQFNFEII